MWNEKTKKWVHAAFKVAAIATVTALAGFCLVLLADALATMIVDANPSLPHQIADAPPSPPTPVIESSFGHVVTSSGFRYEVHEFTPRNAPDARCVFIPNGRGTTLSCF